MNIRQTTVSSWENGVSVPDYPTLIKLADFFEVSTDFLLGRSDELDVVIKNSDENNQLSELERQILAVVREYPKGFEDYALNAVKNGRDLAIYAQNKERNKARYQK